MKRKSWLIIIIVSLILLLVGGGIILAGLRADYVTASTQNKSPESNGHEEHEEEHEEEHGTIPAAAIKSAGIRTGRAEAGRIAITLSLPGEVSINADRMAHIVPRVPGIVRQVQKNLGDLVKGGEVIAVLESPQLGQAKIDYLSAKQTFDIAKVDLEWEQIIHQNTKRLLELLKQKPEIANIQSELDGAQVGENKARLLSGYALLQLAKANFDRERELWDKKISSEANFLTARKEYESALAEYTSIYEEISFRYRTKLLQAQRAHRVSESALLNAERRLHILGLTDEDVAALPEGREHDVQVAIYEMRAPFDGTVVEKHIALGEFLREDDDPFVVADLTSVWVNITVYAKDLPLVHTGQQVSIRADGIAEEANGTITYLGPVVGENTRTALARVVLPNSDGHWRPGLFVTASIAVKEEEVPVAVPTSALQTLEDKTVVFVKENGVFELRTVTVGRGNSKLTEITGGLQPGEHYVTEGAFTLKAQLMKESFGEGHAH